MTAQNPPPLRGQCTSCLNPNGVIYRHSYGAESYLCSKCAQQVALWDAAIEQLEGLIFPPLAAWEEIWGNVGGLSKGPEALTRLAERLDTIRQERGEEESQTFTEAPPA